MKRYFFALLFLTPIGCTPITVEKSADLILTNGKIITVDKDNPKAEAIAISGERIIAVGTDREILTYVGPKTTLIDLKGRLTTPGFIEGHGHFMSLGNSRLILDLTQANSWTEIKTMVAGAAKNTEPGIWIEGRGWHQEKWVSIPLGAVDGLPQNLGLSEVSPENPVYLSHASGHAAFANKKAMQIARITRDTPDPKGGTIVRDVHGEPTGALREKAQALVRRVLDDYKAQLSPEDREAEQVRKVELASAEILKNGITSFHDAGSRFRTIDFLRQLAVKNKLPIRLYIMIRNESHEILAHRLPNYFIVNESSGHITVRSIKLQIDGALGSHGAWFLEPYEDLPKHTGLILEQVADITKTAQIALDHGFQVNTHAIGDRANRAVLDIYSKFILLNSNHRTGLRWRIEHAQHIHPNDIPRFAQLGVIASMQGIHCTSDAPWVIKRLGEDRAKSGAYVWRDLIDSGAIVTNGTDTPVENLDPISGFHALVTRRTKTGTAFFPDQVMTRLEALESYTLSNAYAAFEEDIKGSITPGKYADITVLSKDILSIPYDEILSTTVIYTIVGGEILYADKTALD